MTHKGAIKILFLLLIIIVIGLSATIFSFNDQQIAEDAQNKAQDVIKEGSEKIIDKVAQESRVAVGEKLKETGEKMLVTENGTPGSYQNYDERSLAMHEKNVLFFTAAWCPSCMEMEKVLEAQQQMIPSGVAIYAVDYDANAQLRDRYHVEKQHTFIQVDQQGNEIARWENSMTMEDLTSHIQ